jgi:hypothetical protein
MAGGGFAIDPSSLQAAASQVEGISGELAAAASTVGSAIAAGAGAIGNDSQGLQFAARFNPDADALRRALDTMSGQLMPGVEAALRWMASSYQGADQAGQARGGRAG